MNKKFILSASLCAIALSIHAQKVDFDYPGRNGQVTESGYQSWEVQQVISDTKRIQLNETDFIDITMNCGDETTVNRTMRAEWLNKAQANKLVGDGVVVRGLDDSNNTPELTDESATLNFILKGLKPGEHSLLIYMNVCSKVGTPSAPVDILVNGTKVDQVTMSDQKIVTSESAQAYLQFTAEEGKDVTISLISRPDGVTEYKTTGIYVNALVFDQPNPKTTALDPYPENLDLHLDADNGSVGLKWTAATIATKHILYVGTEEGNWNVVSGTELTNPEYTLNGLTTHNTYY